MTFLPKRNEMLSLKVNKEEKAELKATSKTVGKAVQKILLIGGLKEARRLRYLWNRKQNRKQSEAESSVDIESRYHY